MLIIKTHNGFLFYVKRLWKPFAVVFVLAWIVSNWGGISWVFNYEVVSQQLRGLFPQKTAAEDTAELSFQPQEKLVIQNRPESETDDSDEPVDESIVIEGDAAEDAPASDAGEPAAPTLANGISIPAIGIKAPIVIANTTDNTALHTLLDKGVVMYPGPVPGEIGQTILLGHSAPPGWPNIKYDWVFTKINLLKPGNAVTVNYGGATFTYSVKSTIFLDRGEELPKDSGGKGVLYLISCWPPGKDYKRIAVEATLIE